MSKRIDILNNRLPVGYHIATWSPGDGVTRYRICPDGQDYFSTSGMPTALGFRAAETMVEAFAAGWHASHDAAQAMHDFDWALERARDVDAIITADDADRLTDAAPLEAPTHVWRDAARAIESGDVARALEILKGAA